MADVNIKMRRGKLNALPTTKTDGHLYFATMDNSAADSDGNYSGYIYLDSNGKRYSFGRFVEYADRAGNATRADYTPTAGSADTATEADKAKKWSATKVFKVTDASGENAGTAVNVDGTKDVTLKMPLTFKGNHTIDGELSINGELSISGNTSTSGNVTLNGDGNTFISNIDNQFVKQIQGNVSLAHNNTTGDGKSGYHLIEINSTINWMMAFTIRLFQGYKYTDIVVSGYNRTADQTWNNVKAVILGTNGVNSMVLTFGCSAANKLWVAVPAANYYGIDIINVTNGYRQISDYANLFTVSYVDAIPTSTPKEAIVKTAYAPWYRGQIVSTDNGGTGNNAFTANRLLYSESATKLSSSGHYASIDKVAINSTEIDDTLTFYVSGNSKISGEFNVGGNADFDNNLNVDGLITQGEPTSNTSIDAMNKFKTDLFVEGSGAAPNTPTVAGFYLGKSTTDDNRHMDIVSGGDYSYIDFNKASLAEDYRVRLIANVSNGLTSIRWAQAASNKKFSIEGALNVTAGATITGDASITNLLTVGHGATHRGIKVGNTYINAIDNRLIFQNVGEIRFGNDAWDYNEWAGLKYAHSDRSIYLGLADNSIFTANAAQTGGKLLLPSIEAIYFGNSTLNESIVDISNTGTWVAACNGSSFINSKKTAGAFSPMLSGPTTNGRMTVAFYNNSLQAAYITKANCDSNKNEVGKTAILFDESGNASWPGSVTVTTNLTVQGNTVLGDSATDSATIYGSLSKLSGHIYLDGAANSSASNTTQIIFRKGSAEHYAISSNDDCFVVNPTSGSTANQIALYLGDRAGTTSKLPSKLQAPGFIGPLTGNVTGNADTATKATQDGSGNTITSTYVKKAGDTMSGNLTISQASGSVGVYAERSDTAVKASLLVGSGGVNRGVYDNSLEKWIVYSDGTDARTQLKLYGAVWNDYAEFRKAETIEPGRIVVEHESGKMKLSSERLQAGANVTSDTFGFAIGETDECKTPIAVAGRALVYTYEDRNSYPLGAAVCAAPGGTVSLMTREEIREWPDRIIGTVSEIPKYETWGEDNIAINGRIWIKVR